MNPPECPGSATQFRRALLNQGHGLRVYAVNTACCEEGTCYRCRRYVPWRDRSNVPNRGSTNVIFPAHLSIPSRA